jgi:hypothetical protein
MRRISIILALVAVMVPGLSSQAGAAKPAKSLRCAFTGVMTFSPGISMTPQGGTFSGAGTVVCQRQPERSVISGPIAFNGTTSAVDDCAAGAGSGTLVATLTEADATTTVVTARFTELRDGLRVSGPVTGTGNDEALGELHFLIVPGISQNCVVAPIRRGNVTGGLSLAGSIR